MKKDINKPKFVIDEERILKIADELYREQGVFDTIDVKLRYFNAKNIQSLPREYAPTYFHVMIYHVLRQDNRFKKLEKTTKHAQWTGTYPID